jgi:hypothetical protein
MKSVEVGDVVVYSNGQQFRVVGNVDGMGNGCYLLVGINDWQVYREINFIHNMDEFNSHKQMQVVEVIPASKVQSIRVL